MSGEQIDGQTAGHRRCVLEATYLEMKMWTEDRQKHPVN